MGAVFSDVLAWSIRGEPGRADYRCKREEAIAELSHLKASGFDACFHNGVDERLTVVDEFHDDLLKLTRRTDVISPSMHNVIIDYMLTTRQRRLNATQIKAHAEAGIQGRSSSMQTRRRTADSVSFTGRPTHLPQHPRHTNRGFSEHHQQGLPEGFASQPLWLTEVSTHEETSPMHGPNFQESPSEVDTIQKDHGARPVASRMESPNPSQLVYRPVDHNQSPSMAQQPSAQPMTGSEAGPNKAATPGQGHVSVDNVYEMLQKKHSRRSFIVNTLNRIQSKPAEIMGLPGMQEARIKLQNRKGRDQER